MLSYKFLLGLSVSFALSLAAPLPDVVAGIGGSVRGGGIGGPIVGEAIGGPLGGKATGGPLGDESLGVALRTGPDSGTSSTASSSGDVSSTICISWNQLSSGGKLGRDVINALNVVGDHYQRKDKICRNDVAMVTQYGQAGKAVNDAFRAFYAARHM